MRFFKKSASQPTGGTLISRRKLLGAGTVGAAGLVAGSVSGRARAQTVGVTAGHSHLSGMAGRVDHKRNGFNPTDMLTDWDTGVVSTLETGQVLRTYRVVATDKRIEVAPGVFFEAWTYNGRVPGPTLRCTEGDRIRIEFINGGSHPHTMHFHGIHSARMDGVPGAGPGMIDPGDRTVYEFDAFPFGCHLYHCHAVPLRRHIHKGLYGGFIVDPDPAKHPENADVATSRSIEGAKAAGIKEFVMVMNGFDTDFDAANEVYAVNTVGFHFMNEPIRISSADKVRVYLINITEFDPINSIHLHANFFDYFDHGTTLTPTLKTVDTIMQCQAQRGILEFNFNGFEAGNYMFHAHQSEFAELGWMGFFEVVDGPVL